MLGRDDDGVDPHRIVVLVVLDRDLALAVGTKIGELSALAHRGESSRELVRESDCGGHQLGVLVRGITEHHALVACAAGIHAHGDVARLLVDARNHGTRIRVEAIERIVVANGLHHAAHERLKVDIGLGGNFAGDHNQTGRGQGFAGHAAERVLRQAGIEDGIRNLIGNLIRMPFRYRLRGK